MNKPDTCPGYSADIDTEYNRVTENGTKVCGSCNCFKYEDANGYGLSLIHISEPTRRS